jgi:hypothetical protein
MSSRGRTLVSCRLQLIAKRCAIGSKPRASASCEGIASPAARNSVRMKKRLPAASLKWFDSVIEASQAARYVATAATMPFVSGHWTIRTYFLSAATQQD